MMQSIFYLMYGALLFKVIYDSVKSASYDHIFAPWPGYTLLFSSYFLIGSQLSLKPIPEEQWLTYILAICGFTIGALVVASAFEKKKKSISSAKEIYWKFVKSFNFKIIFIFSVLSYIVTAYLWLSGGIPLFSKNVDEARMAYASSGYLATIATTVDVMSVCCLAYVLVNRKLGLKKNNYWAYLIIVSFVVIAILSGSRSRLLKFIVPSLILVHFLYFQIRIWKILLFGLIGLVFVGVIGYYRAYNLLGDDIWYGLGQAGADSPLLGIIYYGQIELSTAVYGLSVVIENMPSKTDFTFGLLQISPLLMPLPFDSTPTPGMFFKTMIGGTWHGAGLAATFISPMYADFSFGGVLVSSALYSAIFSYLYQSVKILNTKFIYRLITYSILYFFMIAGIRSDFVSFEFWWFLFISILLYVFKKPLPIYHQQRQEDLILNKSL
ncbi:O-antigen polymerase [Dyadobacter alkalitolerans]|uniref:O-antigen polymerase n=1 Tax=Dyadobacter alkalitolerans TaxID=492736 RepID=UPI00041271D8|nr:O-antigen polymerase [Dyadobacter alkalitolerans]